jgi:hypothetical protein
LDCANCPQRQRPGIYARSSSRDAQLPAGLCADWFGGATTAVTGYTKNSSLRGWRREQMAGRAMDEKPSNPTSTKMVAMQVHGTSRNLTGAAVCHSPISIAGSSTSKLRPSDVRRPTTGWGGQISGAMELRTGGPGSHARSSNSRRKAHLCELRHFELSSISNWLSPDVRFQCPLLGCKNRRSLASHSANRSDRTTIKGLMVSSATFPR